MELPFPADRWEDVEAHVQEQRTAVFVTRLAGRTRVLIDWPRANAGHYEIRARCGTDTHRRTVSIAPSKLSDEALAILLHDLEERLPIQVALALQRLGAFTGVGITPPDDATVASELLRLERAVDGTSERPGLAAVLRQLGQQHHRMLVPFELPVSSVRARHPEPSRLHQALHPTNLMQGIPAGERIVPRTVIDRRVRHSADVYENRLVKLYWHQVASRLRRFRRHVPAGGEVAARAAALEASLLQARAQASFLDEVTLPDVLPTKPTMVLLSVQPYRAALEGFLEFNRSYSVRLEDPALDAPFENIPYLYQQWGYLMVAHVLLHVGAELGFELEAQSLVRRDAAGLFTNLTSGGVPTVTLIHRGTRRTARLYSERSYGATGSLRSISFTQRPDVSVLLETPGERPQLLLFDAKYKLEGDASPPEPNADPVTLGLPKKVDIDKMHAYRDALRDERGRHIVRHAAILYPGRTVAYTAGLAAIGAVPGSPEVAKELRATLLAALDSVPNELRLGAFARSDRPG